MSSFWLTFIVTEAISVAQAFTAVSNIPPGIKAALEGFIQSGQNLVLAIQAGK